MVKDITMNIGDKVNHYRFGEGVITGFDTSTYSIVMVTIKFSMYDDEICRPFAEIIEQ